MKGEKTGLGLKAPARRADTTINPSSLASPGLSDGGGLSVKRRATVDKAGPSTAVKQSEGVASPGTPKKPAHLIAESFSASRTLIQEEIREAAIEEERLDDSSSKLAGRPSDLEVGQEEQADRAGAGSPGAKRASSRGSARATIAASTTSPILTSNREADWLASPGKEGEGCADELEHARIGDELERVLLRDQAAEDMEARPTVVVTEQGRISAQGKEQVVSQGEDPKEQRLFYECSPEKHHNSTAAGNLNGLAITP